MADAQDENSETNQILGLAGIEAVVERADHPVRIECLRAAQRLHRQGCTSIGLLPASADVGVVGAGVNLALALAELSGSTVGYVDANLRWPALAGRPGGARGSSADFEDLSEVTVDSPFSTRWLRGDVALLVPRRRGASGSGLGALSKVLSSAKDLFATCLIDLTGWRRLGEHMQAFALLDGIVVVARAGLTTEDQLLRLNAEIPAHRHLGVLLIGGPSET